MRLLTIIILITALFSCRKDKVHYNFVSEITGKYTGGYFENQYGYSGQGWALYNPVISENNYHSVLVSGWPSGLGNIVMEVKGKELSITDKIDTVTSYGMGGEYVFVYLLKLNANGTFNSETNSIYMSFVEETMPLNSSGFDTTRVGYISISK